MKKYASKNMTSLILIWACLSLALSLFYFSGGHSTQFKGLSWWGTGLFCCSIFLLLVSWPIYYEIGNRFLLIRMGMIRFRFALENITRITSDFKWRGFPREGVLVFYKKGWMKMVLFLNPENKNLFFEDFVKLAKGFKITNGEVLKQSD